MHTSTARSLFEVLPRTARLAVRREDMSDLLARDVL
jgi:hypothetical protein